MWRNFTKGNPAAEGQSSVLNLDRTDFQPCAQFFYVIGGVYNCSLFKFYVIARPILKFFKFIYLLEEGDLFVYLFIKWKDRGSIPGPCAC